MLEHDEVVSIGGLPIASFGPRAEVGGVIEDVAPEEAQFWGVYLHDFEGRASHQCDVTRRLDARAMAQALSEAANPLTVAYMALAKRDFTQRAIGPDDLPKILCYAPVLDTLLRHNDPRLADAATRFLYGGSLMDAYSDVRKRLDAELAVGIARDCIADSVKRL
ncbi:MAG TPA: hypothetical protein VF292_03990 [Rhodanobacteraceae bacterium]